MSFQAGTYDFLDDGGALLKEFFPSLDDIPEIIKTADERVGPETPGNMFALVLVENGQVMKKFATADAGHTYLSTLYFHSTHHNLPDEAQKVAAANLLQACDAYGFEAPDLLEKLAEGVEPGPNVVDVTDGVVGLLEPEKKEVRFAIERADGSKYFPLEESAESVKVADEYFKRNVGNFVPRERREYAVKVAQVAAVADLPLSEELRHYASDEYNPAIHGYLDARYHHLLDADSPEAKRVELQKLAAQVGEVPAAQFVESLADFDRSVGLDRLWDDAVPDPWYCTFGLPDMTKVAKGDAAEPETWTVGTDTVTEEELKTLAAQDAALVNTYFGEDFMRAFRDDPITQFRAAPLPSKKVLMRMANGTFAQGN